MKERKTAVSRETKETKISCALSMDAGEPLEIATSVPFFNHLLHAMSFHGGFSLVVHAQGDLEIDAHHLVEDTGLVLGDALAALSSQGTPLVRFGHAVIPMDEALSEVAVDVCGRSSLSYTATFPQKLIGTFDTALIREFLNALSQQAKISLHAKIREGQNSHHMAESLFKALGKAINAAYKTADNKVKGMSTKGAID